WATVHLTPLGHTTISRLFLWFELAVAILAGFGLQSLLDAPRQRRVWSVVAVGLAAGLIAIVVLEPSLHQLRTTQNHFRTGRDYADRTVISLTSIAWWLIFVVGLGAIL